MGKWDKYAVEAPQASKWDKYAAEVPRDTSDDPSMLESGIRGAHQTLTGGFQDELAGIGTYLGEKASNLINDTENPNVLETYRKGRDEARQANELAEKANPNTYLAGGIAGALPGAIALGGANLAGTVGAGAVQGGTTAFGSSNADFTTGDIEQAKQAAKEIALGTLIGGAGGALGYGAGKLVGKMGSPAVSSSLKSRAEKLAVNATGATGKQAEAFAPNTGRELLDRGIVRFGQSAEDVAERAAQAMDQSNLEIDQVLKTLDDSGTVIDKDMIYDALRNRLQDLKKNPADAPQARQLQSVLRDIANSPDQYVLPSEAEITKRTFQNKAKGFYGDPYKGDALKSAGNAYKEAVEGSAQDLSPELASKFETAKKTYGLFAPVEEFASRRASTLNQSPWGGLLDTTATIGGTVLSGTPAGGVTSSIARRSLAPRLSSSAAVSIDKLSKNIDKLGQFAPVMQSAIQRGSQAAAATHFALSSQFPSYREMTKQIEEE
jgi:hypothetical protein